MDIIEGGGLIEMSSDDDSEGEVQVNNQVQEAPERMPSSNSLVVESIAKSE